MENPAPIPLLDFPADVLRHICAAFCHHCTLPNSLPFYRLEIDDDGIFRHLNQEGINSLNALSKTCRTLRDIAQPLMYHAPIIYSYSRFIKTLTERRDLAAVVKVYQYVFRVREYGQDFPSWAVHEYVGYVIDMAHSMSIMNAEDTIENVLFLRSGFTEGLQQPVDPSESGVFRERYASFIHYQLAWYDKVAQQVALALLPNLEVVVVSSTAEDDLVGGLAMLAMDQDVFDHLAPVRSAPASVWSHLRTLVIEDVVGAGRMYQQDPALFRLPHFGNLINQSPNLENLVFITTSAYEGHRPLTNQELRIPLAGIRSITVHGRNVGRLVGSEEEISPQPYLEKLIAQCPQLERLSIRARAEQIDEWEGRSDFSPSRTIRDAWAVRKTLKQLALYSSYVQISGEVIQTGLGAILHEFTALESLVIDEQCFCSHWLHPENEGEISQSRSDERPFCLTSNLPQSVTCLTVRLHDGMYAVDDIVELGRQVVAGGFPRLCRLIVKVVDETMAKARLGMHKGRLRPEEREQLNESVAQPQREVQANTDKHAAVIKDAWKATSVDVTVHRVVEDVFCSALPHGLHPFHHGM